MKEILDLIKSEFSKFFVTFFNVLSSPKDGLIKLYNQYYSDDKKHEGITNAVVFFIICNCILSFVILPPISDKSTLNFTSYILSLFFKIIVFVIFSALALQTAWHIVRTKISYYKYFILTCYQMGVAFTIYMVFNIINLGILRLFSIEKFNAIVLYIFKGGQTDPFPDPFSDNDVLLFYTLGLMLLIIVMVWFYRGLSAFRIIHRKSKWKGFFAAIIYSLLMVVVFFIDYALEKLLLGSKIVLHW